MPNPFIAALDVPDSERALKLVDQLFPLIGSFKIGSELFTAAGPDIVRRIRGRGAAVFLDLKFHDIPNTVAKAVAAATRLDVQMLTLHASGGLEMMRAAAEAAPQAAHAASLHSPPLLLGVTVLTSLDGSSLEEVGQSSHVGRQVERLATLAAKAGLGGLVCSPLEIAGLRQILRLDLKLVTPGIRAPGDGTGDQRRTLSAKEALEAGADWLVIGRPICAAENPRAAAERLLASLA